MPNVTAGGRAEGEAKIRRQQWTKLGKQIKIYTASRKRFELRRRKKKASKHEYPALVIISYKKNDL